MMTRVFDVIRRETLSADSVNVSGSISAKTGFPPMRLTASAVKAAVRGVVTTSSPGPTPTAIKARVIASVPFPTPTALLQSKAAAISRSHASTSGPRMYQPEARTLAMAALRVKDVLQEIERQRPSLHRQAKKAERLELDRAPG